MPPRLKNIVGRVLHSEKGVLGCLVEFCSQGSAKQLDFAIASGITADQFTNSDNREIFRAMVALRNEGKIPDEASLIDKLGDRLMAYVWDFTKGVVPENLDSQVCDLRRAWRDFGFSKQVEELARLTNSEERRACLHRMQETLRSGEDAQEWRSIFHSWEEFENSPPLRFAIEGFLQEAGVTLIGGLAGHGKTFLMLSMAKALLEALPLFGYEQFTVPRQSDRVIYLIPEASMGPFWSRLQLFRLQEHVRSGRLLVRTLSSHEQVTLGDPRLLKAVEGADVFLDTAVRFMNGSENDVDSARPFADTLFRLINIGARSITGAHHAPKSFESQDHMTLENILRGSGDIGAMLSTAWGVRQVDAERNMLYVQNVKPRDFQPCPAFLLQGRPHLDNTGNFLMTCKPGEAGELRSHLHRKGGRPVMPDKAEKAAQAVALRGKGLSLRQIEEQIGISKSAVGRLLFDYDSSQTCPTDGQVLDRAVPDKEKPNNGFSPLSGGF